MVTLATVKPQASKQKRRFHSWRPVSGGGGLLSTSYSALGPTSSVGSPFSWEAAAGSSSSTTLSGGMLRLWQYTTRTRSPQGVRYRTQARQGQPRKRRNLRMRGHSARATFGVFRVRLARVARARYLPPCPNTSDVRPLACGGIQSRISQSSNTKTTA
jgi:hypothetical protein